MDIRLERMKECQVGVDLIVRTTRINQARISGSVEEAYNIKNSKKTLKKKICQPRKRKVNENVNPNQYPLQLLSHKLFIPT